MPGFNGTGPAGEGPMTGGGRGNCATDDRTVMGRLARRGPGFGLGLGFGRGRDRFGAGQGRGMGLGRRGQR